MWEIFIYTTFTLKLCIAGPTIWINTTRTKAWWSPALLLIHIFLACPLTITDEGEMFHSAAFIPPVPALSGRTVNNVSFLFDGDCSQRLFFFFFLLLSSIIVLFLSRVLWRKWSCFWHIYQSTKKKENVEKRKKWKKKALLLIWAD